jgi:type I restriction enzyme R subunit
MAVQQAFALYDAGARIEQVQDLKVVYDIKDRLDEAGIYDDTHLEAFKIARFKTAKAMAQARDPEHKELYAATQEPTDFYNDRLERQRKAVQAAEDEFQRCKEVDDEIGMKAADHQREEAAREIGILVEFKSGLARFVRTYAYIAQLIDLGDPNLENYAAFAKLLAKRLDGIAPENVDLSGLALKGYDIKARETTTTGGGDDEEDDIVLHPVGAGGSPAPGGMPVYLKELIEKLNKLFGEAAPLKDQAQFVNHVVSITRENKLVMAQVDKADKDLAMKGSLPGAVQQAVVRAMKSNNSLASLLLKEDRQAMSILTNLVYDLLKTGEALNLEDVEPS